MWRLTPKTFKANSMATRSKLQMTYLSSPYNAVYASYPRSALRRTEAPKISVSHRSRSIPQHHTIRRGTCPPLMLLSPNRACISTARATRTETLAQIVPDRHETQDSHQEGVTAGRGQHMHCVHRREGVRQKNHRCFNNEAVISGKRRSAQSKDEKQQNPPPLARKIIPKLLTAPKDAGQLPSSPRQIRPQRVPGQTN